MTSVGTAVSASTARKKPLSGSSPNARPIVLVKRRPDRAPAEQHGQPHDPEQRHRQPPAPAVPQRSGPVADDHAAAQERRDTRERAQGERVHV